MDRRSTPFTAGSRTRPLRTVPNRRIPGPRAETQILPGQKRVFGTSRTNIPAKPELGKPTRKQNPSETVMGCPENPKSETDTTVVAEKVVNETATVVIATDTDPNPSVGDETVDSGTNKITDPITEAPETEPSDETETTIPIPRDSLETAELKSAETQTEGKKVSGDPNAGMKKTSQGKVVQNQARKTPKTEPSHETEPEFLISAYNAEAMDLKYQTIEDSKAASEVNIQEQGAQIPAPKTELALPPPLDNAEDMETKAREIESRRARLRRQKKNQSETAPYTPVVLSSFSSSSMRRRKPGQAEATPYHSAKQCSSCRLDDRLETSSYWLLQIRLAESAGKHFASAAFFKLAFQSKAEPIKDVRIELRRYLGRHQHLRAEGKWRRVCLSFGLIKDDKDGGKPIPSTAAGSGSC